MKKMIIQKRNITSIDSN